MVMKDGTRKIASYSIILLLFAWQNAMATKVYQWTDEEGITHFSDVPPAGIENTDTREIDFVDYAENVPSDDEYSIINQLERMTEWRRQASEDRMARKQLQMEEQRLADERQSYRFNLPSSSSVVYPAASSYLYPYSYYPGRFSYYKKRSFRGFSAGFHDRGFSAGFGHRSPPRKLRHYKAGPGF